MARAEQSRSFGERVRELRHERGLSRERLAEASDLSVHTVSCVERDEVSPSLETVRKLAKGLGLELSELFGDL